MVERAPRHSRQHTPGHSHGPYLHQRSGRSLERAWPTNTTGRHGYAFGRRRRGHVIEVKPVDPLTMRDANSGARPKLFVNYQSWRFALEKPSPDKDAGGACRIRSVLRSRTARAVCRTRVGNLVVLREDGHDAGCVNRAMGRKSAGIFETNTAVGATYHPHHICYVFFDRSPDLCSIPITSTTKSIRIRR
jgi:hypothetical protein